MGRFYLYTSYIFNNSFNQYPSEARRGSRIFLISLVYVYLFVYLFVSRLVAKWKTIQTWNFAHILPLTLSKNGFFDFSKKTAVSRGYSALF